MEWIQFVIFFVTTVGFLYTIRHETKREIERSNEDRKEIISIMKKSQEEMKDFHGRLCTLEERYLQIITRIK